MTCNIVNNVVGPLNATILVDSQYGRSKAASNLFYVTPDEQIYNFEAYARIYLIRNSLKISFNFIKLYSFFCFFFRNNEFEHKHGQFIGWYSIEHTRRLFVHRCYSAS